jgi:hypothetical protein
MYKRFLLLHRVQTVSRTYTVSCPTSYRGSFHEAKRPKRESDPSPPSGAEIADDEPIPPGIVFLVPWGALRLGPHGMLAIVWAIVPGPDVR